MKKLISKIKGINCRVDQDKAPKEETDVFCYGNNDCDMCCGLKACECNNKLIKRENRV